MSNTNEENDLQEFGIFLLSGDIDDESCGDAIRFILQANLEGDFDHLTLIVNSPGGFVYSGFALIDVMEGSKVPVHTVGIGQIASMGLNIFIAGAKGNRILTPNTMVMSHQYFGEHFGKQHELIAQQKGDEILTKRIIKHYKKHTGLNEKEIKEHLLPAHDVFLTANEAKRLNICDVVKIAKFSKSKEK